MLRSARSPARSASRASDRARRPAGCSRPASAPRRRASRPCATPSPAIWPRPCGSTTSTSSPRPTSTSPVARRTGPSCSTPPSRSGPASACPATAACGWSCPTPRSSDEEVESRIDAVRRPHGELDDVDRPSVKGDFVTLDLSASRDGEPVAGLNAEDWLYEVGRGWIADDFDDYLIGALADDKREFTATPSGHRGAGRLHRHGEEGAGARAPRAHRRVGRGEHRRRVGRGLPGRAARAARSRPPRPGARAARRAGHRRAGRAGRRGPARRPRQQRAAQPVPRTP